jgi:hypothetical protein
MNNSPVDTKSLVGLSRANWRIGETELGSSMWLSIDNTSELPELPELPELRVLLVLLVVLMAARSRPQALKVWPLQRNGFKGNHVGGPKLCVAWMGS